MGDSHQTITLHNKIQNNKCRSVFYGGLSGTKLTLWGFLKNPRTFEIQSGQEKRALEGSFSKNGGLKEETLELLARKLYDSVRDKNNVIFFERLKFLKIA